MASVPLAHPTTWETPRNAAKELSKAATSSPRTNHPRSRTRAIAASIACALLPVVEREGAEGDAQGRARRRAHGASDTAPSAPRA